MDDAIIEQIANRHVERSLAELESQSKVDSWTDGDRARDEATEIVAAVLSEVLGQKGLKNA